MQTALHKLTAYCPTFVRNPYFLLLLSLLSVCLLVDQFYLLSERRYYVMALLLCNVMLFLNFRFWQASFFAVVMAFISFAGQFPRQPNHDNILTGIMLCILITGAIKALKSSYSLSVAFCSGLFRAALVTVYCLSGFHKLNTDFFNPSNSCANLIGENILSTIMGQDIVLPPGSSWFLHILIVLMEMVVPFGLLYPKTRKHAAIALLGFHCCISFYSYSNFSAVMVFLLFGSLFNAGMLQNITPFARALRVYFVFAVASLAVIFIYVRLGIADRFPVFLQGLFFNIGVVYFAFVFFRHYMPVAEASSKSVRIGQGIIVVLLGIWSLKAYAGLGNAGNLTMFSNLVTESSRSNHLLLDTRFTKLNTLEEDNVLILQFPDTITYIRITDMRLPKTEFRYRASKWCERFPDTKIPVTLVYKNDTVVIKDLHHSTFSKTAWWYKYLYFRPFPDKGPSDCAW